MGVLVVSIILIIMSIKIESYTDLTDMKLRFMSKDIESLDEKITEIRKRLSSLEKYLEISYIKEERVFEGYKKTNEILKDIKSAEKSQEKSNGKLNILKAKMGIK